MAEKTKEHWSDEPAAHDFPAARNYLSLVMDDARAKTTVRALRRAPMTRRRANDLLRASGLAVLPTSDPQVSKNLKAIASGERLSPVLAVRGDVAAGRALIIADGYHRICASYHVREDIEIPCRIVGLAAAEADLASPEEEVREAVDGARRP